MFGMLKACLIKMEVPVGFCNDCTSAILAMDTFYEQLFVLGIAFGRKFWLLARRHVLHKTQEMFLLLSCSDTLLFVYFLSAVDVHAVTRALLHLKLCLSSVFVNAQCASGIMINRLEKGSNDEKCGSFSRKNTGLANRGQLNAPPKRVLQIEMMRACQLTTRNSLLSPQ